MTKDLFIMFFSLDVKLEMQLTYINSRVTLIVSRDRKFALLPW